MQEANNPTVHLIPSSHHSYRLAVIADIHGILPTLETILAEIMTYPPDEIAVAGDIVGVPHPHQTLALLREFTTIPDEFWMQAAKSFPWKFDL